MYRLLHIPTGLICYKFSSEKEALNALEFFRESLENKCTVELYTIENAGFVCVSQESALSGGCERKVYTTREFMVIEE